LETKRSDVTDVVLKECKDASGHIAMWHVSGIER